MYYYANKITDCSRSQLWEMQILSDFLAVFDHIAFQSSVAHNSMKV